MRLQSLFVCTAGLFGPTELSNMMEESVTMAKFNHPNVMRLIGVCIDKGPSPYILMPYMAYIWKSAILSEET